MSKTDTTPQVPAHLIGHLDWPTQGRFVLGVAAAWVIVASLGFSVIEPWDPVGAISALVMDGCVWAMFRLTLVLVATTVLATIIIDARLPLFGMFASMAALGYPIAKTGGMDYLMVRLQATHEYNDPQLWAYLTFEMIGWTICLAAILASAVWAERWLKRDDPDRPTLPKLDVKEITRALGATALSAAAALIFVSVFCQSRDKGQVMFAVAGAFFLSAWLGDWAMGNRRIRWQIASVPLAACVAYIYTWMNPSRPNGLEAILYITPNNLVAVLPIEYFAVGTAGAIFGYWTAERTRFAEHHEQQKQQAANNGQAM